MFDKLIDFLIVLNRLPGFGWAGTLSDRMRQATYRRIAMRAKLKSHINKVKKVKDSGADLMGLKNRSKKDEAQNAGTKPQPATQLDDNDGPTPTLIIPRPTGRSAASDAATPFVQSMQTALPPLDIRGSGLNPLLDAATELFSLTGRLRSTVVHPDVEGLRAHLERKVAAFDRRARAAAVPNEQVVAARYALCTLLDEIALTTPWGAESLWSQHSLLSQFHDETWGGEKFFLMLERVIREPARHLHLLEFMYLCIALGLEGKYRVLDRGHAALKSVADNLFLTIRGTRGEFERALSPRWQGVEDRRNRLARLVPLWAVGSLSAAVLLAAYVGFMWNLARSSEPVYRQIARIGQDARLSVAVAPVERTLTLREVLAQDIRAGAIDVIEQTRGSTVEIRGDGLFASGSAEIDAPRQALLQRIGDALNQFSGPVLVTGHTDNQPIAGSRGVRFPTNWHLSQARAESVSALLATRLANAGRLKTEGRGETEPKAANDTPEQRARNRRVEVTLLNAPQTSRTPRPGTAQAALTTKEPS